MFLLFLNEDPKWWIKDARIKEPEKQLYFFNLCKERKFDNIKTKRKGFKRPV